MYTAVETNSFWIYEETNSFCVYIYIYMYKFVALGQTPDHKTKNKKSNPAVFSFFHLILQEGYVDSMRYSCNSLRKQTRLSGWIFEVVRVEISMLFNVNLRNQK